MSDLFSTVCSRWESLDDKKSANELCKLEKRTIQSHKKQLKFIIENCLVVNSTIFTAPQFLHLFLKF